MNHEQLVLKAESIILNTETVRFMNEHTRELNLC